MKSSNQIQAASEQVERVDDETNSEKVHLKSYLLVLAINMIFFAHVFNIAGSGALARNIVAVTGGADKTVWFTSIMSLMGAVLSLPVSEAADYWGRKVPVIFFTSMGCVGSIIVARSNSIGVLLVGFFFSGMALGAQPMVPTISSEVLPRKFRPYAQGFVNASGSVSLITALLVGAALTNNGHNAGFRTHFEISAGIFAFAAILCAVTYHPPKREYQLELRFFEKVRKLDWMAYTLLTIGIVLFCLGLSWSQNPYPWSDAHVSAPFALGVAFLIALVVRACFKKDGVINHRLFQHRNYPIALGCLFVEGVCFFSANNYLPLEGAVLYSTDAFKIVLPLCVSSAAAIVLGMLGAAFSAKTKTVRPTAVCAYVFYVIFFALSASITSDTPTKNFSWYPVFIGGGVGLCLASLMTAAQFATPLELISTTTGIAFSIRNLGGTVGLAIFNTVYHHGIASNLAKKVAAATVAAGLPASSLGSFITALASQNTQALSRVAGATPAVIAAGERAMRDTQVIGLRYVWVTAGSLAVAALVASLFLQDPKAAFNAHVDAPVEAALIARRDEEKTVA